jgi:hypothetical protein
LRSDPLDVHVLALPETGRPPGFRGAVGDFRFTLEADSTVLRANEPLTIRATVTGPGSVTTLGKLDFEAPEGVRLFDSGQDARSFASGDVVMAEKTYTWILVPSGPKPLRIAPLELPAFNPEQGRYEILTTAPLALDVLPGPAADLVTLGGTSRPLEEHDIRYLKTVGQGLRWRPEGRALGPYPWVHGIPLLALGASWIFNARRSRREADVEGNRRNGAFRRARGRLARLDEAGDGWPQVLAETMEAYLADRLGASGRGTPRSRLLPMAAGRGLGPALMGPLEEILEASDAIAFAPRGRAEGDERLPDRALDLLSRLEEAFRNAEPSTGSGRRR